MARVTFIALALFALLAVGGSAQTAETFAGCPADPVPFYTCA